MSNSREDSPDWLHCFQAPTYSTVAISSDSSLSTSDGPERVDITMSQLAEGENDSDSVPREKDGESPSSKISRKKAPRRKNKEDSTSPSKKKKKRKVHSSSVADEDVEIDEGSAPDKVSDHLILALSSDSESSPDGRSKAKARRLHTQKNEEDMDAINGGSTDLSVIKKAPKEKSPKKKLKLEDDTLNKGNSTNDLHKKGENEDLEAAEEDTTEKPTGPRVSTSSLSLVLSEKVQRSKALVECEGDSIDLSGDIGAVGRVMVQDTTAGNSDVYFDLKGTIYRTSIVPSRTFCVVSFSQSEAKIEAIMNDFIKLTPVSNVYEAETMVEGTLEGFSFDSEDEAEKVPKHINQQNQNEGLEEQPNGGKTKGKAEKASKKNKNAGGKSHPVKRGAKKTQGPKRGKAKK
ncbi:DNA-binding protein BIN4 [Linum grandiflorum]